MKAKKANSKFQKNLDDNELGKYIRSQRTEANWPLATLADKLGVTKGYLSRLECGKTKPSAQMIDQIGKILKIDTSPLKILSGQLPADLKQIFYEHPLEAPAVLRETFESYEKDKKKPSEIKTLELQKPGSKSKTSDSKNLYKIVHADCFVWLDRQAPNSVHAVVTDPPYGLKEYTSKEKAKLRRGAGGVWRIPPSFDGNKRSPVPRFTVLTEFDKLKLKNFFACWAPKIFRALVPGGHIFIATNPLVSHLVYISMIEAGFEKRGEIIRLVQTLRGGDRPKNAHEEFHNVTVMPRSCWEPWGLFRKPCEGRVQDNLRKWKTGGLRRVSDDQPFSDVIKSSPTRAKERQIAPHPSLKPQAFMRKIVYASLPLGEGLVLDPFMGGGSTIAACCAVGYKSIGIESDHHFFKMASKAIPLLTKLVPNGDTNGGNGIPSKLPARQQTLF